MDSKNFTIGVLSTTASILFVGLLIVNTRPAPAIAGAMTTVNGEYVLTVGTASIDNEEYVYVIDAPAEKLVVYHFNNGKQTIEVVDGVDLAMMRQQATSQPPPQKGKKRGKRGGRKPRRGP